jgi:hypothetical protein
LEAADTRFLLYVASKGTSGNEEFGQTNNERKKNWLERLQKTPSERAAKKIYVSTDKKT